MLPTSHPHSADASAATTAAEPARPDSSRGGRPASNPARWPREYRDKLRAAGTDVAAITRANEWARRMGVPLDAAAERAERSAPPRPLSTAVNAVNLSAELTGRPVVDVPYTQVAPPVSPLVEAEPPGPDLVEPTAADAGSAEASAAEATAADDGGPYDAPEVDAEPEDARAPRPPDETFMGEAPDLVAALAQGPAFVLGALARLTEGRAIDLTKPVKVTLMRGTPHAREVDADPVGRLSELIGVWMARKQEAAAAELPAGEVAKPGVGYELLPLVAAFAVTVGAPVMGTVRSVAGAAGGWMLRGAQGAAAGLGRVFSRGGAA